jgi:hypothetical protein
MINEIRERDVSQIKNVEQQQVARLRLAVLAELANRTNAFQKIRNGINTKKITLKEKQNLANAIRKATKGDPLKLENGRTAESEEDILIRLAQNPNESLALARLNIAQGRRGNEVKAMKKVGEQNRKNRSV